jgi:hypothetical protein
MHPNRMQVTPVGRVREEDVSGHAAIVEDDRAGPSPAPRQRGAGCARLPLRPGVHLKIGHPAHRLVNVDLVVQYVRWLPVMSSNHAVSLDR